jgi:hypothetical protein
MKPMKIALASARAFSHQLISESLSFVTAWIPRALLCFEFVLKRQAEARLLLLPEFPVA